MAVTYKTAADRDALRRSRVGGTRLPRVDRLEWFLGAVSVVAAVLVVTTYFGVVRLPRSAAPDVAPLNLNGMVSAERLESILERVFPLPADRRVAGQQLLSFIETADGGRRSLPNVGAIARVRVPVAAIERVPAASAFRERVEQERERARSLGRDALVSVPLLTSAQLSAVKPFFVVRDTAAMRWSLVLWTLMYLLAFHGVSVVWRLKKIRGDRVLLVAAHLLTAIGLAAMISRPDPLRM